MNFLFPSLMAVRLLWILSLVHRNTLLIVGGEKLGRVFLFLF